MLNPTTTVLSADHATQLDDIANVLHYLRNVEPLRGCDFNDDDAMHSGRLRILEWLEDSVRAIGADEVTT